MFQRPQTSFSKRNKYKPNNLTANIENCGYASVERCLKNVGYKITADRYYNLLYWCDTNNGLQFPLTLQKWQFVNHFPGTFSISKKIDLARNIERIQKYFPELYTFHPKSFILPTQSLDLQMFLSSHSKKTFIIKPDLGSQGRGIFLVQDAQSVKECTEPAIAQEYISPFLINQLKFDLRIYVLVTSVDPLRIYIFDEGMARFCTEPYKPPSSDNLSEIYRHLTNYSLNKHNDNFKQNENTEGNESMSHKQSKSFVFKEIEKLGYDVEQLQKDIDEIIILTLLSVEPFLAHNYRAIFKSEEDQKSRCFEILGFDILIDEDLKPWVLEVNHSPSLSCDSAFDTELKDAVITGALKIVNIDPTFIEKMQKIEHQKTLKRLVTTPANKPQNSQVKTSKSLIIPNDNFINIQFNVETEYRIAKTQTQWRLIYPCSINSEIYDEVHTTNASLPMGGMDETNASRQRKEAVQAYIQSIEERNSPPKRVSRPLIKEETTNNTIKSPKISVTKLTPSYNRPTKSVLLFREAQMKKIKQEMQKEIIYLVSPEYENYLKMEKSGRISKSRSPTLQNRPQTRGNITKPLQ